MQRICGPFFRIYLCLSTDFINHHVFFAARLSLRQPKTLVSNATNLRTFCFEDYHYAFQETLRPVTLAHQIFVFYSNLYFYTSDTFRPILALFTHFTLHQFVLMYITTRNITLIPDDAVARNLIIIFNFSSQRPHLNYIFLSNVYSFDTMEFSMKHKY